MAPYIGSEGYSGTDTSKARAEKRDAGGYSEEVRETVLTLAAQAMEDGITVAELRDQAYAHHGTASGALTVLHKNGDLARLKETRNGCKIYVLPRFIDDRETETFLSNKQKAQIATLTEAHDELRKMERGAAKMYRPGLRLARAVIQRKITGMV